MKDIREIIADAIGDVQNDPDGVHRGFDLHTAKEIIAALDDAGYVVVPKSQWVPFPTPR